MRNMKCGCKGRQACMIRIELTDAMMERANDKMHRAFAYGRSLRSQVPHIGQNPMGFAGEEAVIEVVRHNGLRYEASQPEDRPIAADLTLFRDGVTLTVDVKTALQPDAVCTLVPTANLERHRWDHYIVCRPRPTGLLLFMEIMSVYTHEEIARIEPETLSGREGWFHRVPMIGRCAANLLLYSKLDYDDRTPVSDTLPVVKHS